MLEQDTVILVVAPGKSLLCQADGGLPCHLKENDILSVDNPQWMKDRGLVDKDIKKWVKNGRVIKTVLSDGTASVPLRDAQTITPVVPGANTGMGIQQELPRNDEDLLPEPTGQPSLGAPAGVAPGRWSFDPATIQNHTLMDLNQLIASVDPSVPAFDTVEEARVFLSSEFVPPASSGQVTG